MADIVLSYRKIKFGIRSMLLWNKEYLNPHKLG